MKLAIATVLCVLLLLSIPTTWAGSYGSGAYGSGPYGTAEVSTIQPTGSVTSGGCTISYTLTSPASVTGAAGSSVTVLVTVFNVGTCSGSVTITATVPAGWTATSTTTKLLGKDQSDTVNITLTIPADAAASTLTFKGAVSGKVYNSTTTVSMAAAPAPTPTPSPTMPQPTPAEEHKPPAGPTGISELLVISLTLITVFLAGLLYYRRWGRATRLSDSP